MAEEQIRNEEPTNTNEQNAANVAKADDYDEDFAPTTVVIMLGSMNFEPTPSSDILSLKIQSPDETAGALEEAMKNLKPNSLESLHILLKSSSVSSLFDESILPAFFEAMIPGKEVMVHVLPESAVLAEDMAVQPGDVDSVRTCIVMAGLLLQVEEAHAGSWILTAIKPGLDDSEDEDDESSEDEVRELTEEEIAEEKEFQEMLAKELEKEK
jgi:hypothetical protein